MEKDALNTDLHYMTYGIQFNTDLYYMLYGIQFNTDLYYMLYGIQFNTDLYYMLYGIQFNTDLFNSIQFNFISPCIQILGICFGILHVGYSIQTLCTRSPRPLHKIFT